MKIKEITRYLEQLAPLGMQESYDNSGLIYGDPNTEVTNALISLDCTEEIIDEAIKRSCNLVIAHHPIVFKGLKKLNGKNYVERTVIKAIQNDIAIYAIHTNLDNYHLGVNKKIGSLLNISNPQILSPKREELVKLIVFCPKEQMEQVSSALFEAGAGQIGDYSECSFLTEGIGTFKGGENSNPQLGEAGQKEEVSENKIEVVCQKAKLPQILSSMQKTHPYEEVAYDLIPLLNQDNSSGSGMFGELEEEIEAEKFLQFVKEKFNCGIIRHTTIHKKVINKVAWCGGSGSFLLSAAKSKKADIFITGDFKYHEFFDAEDQIIIADIGHFESEQFTIDLIAEFLRKKFPTFAPCLTGINTNPVNYF
ncbi:MAG: Nif3-like dinuclear metal center hexameric protein [Flavobacteriales bacterium]|nr:Nif3-like dinuclear metal center hexameric protein [Flavobacteriales bacterium]